MKKPASKLVSIVMPVRNESSRFLKAINSIKEQDYKEYECFVIDDGSNQECALQYEVIVKDAGRLFNYVRLNRSVGPATARNTGIKCCNGEIVFFLDADDSWERDYLYNAVRLHDSYPACPVVAFSHNYTRKFTRTKRKGYAGGIMLISIDKVLLRTHLSTPATSIKKDSIIQMFVDGKRYAEDLEFFLANLLLSKCSYIVFSTRICVSLSRRPGTHGGLSAAQAKMYLRSSESFFRLISTTRIARPGLSVILLMRSIRAAIIGLCLTFAKK